MALTILEDALCPNSTRSKRARYNSVLCWRLFMLASKGVMMVSISQKKVVFGKWLVGMSKEIWVSVVDWLLYPFDVLMCMMSTKRFANSSSNRPTDGPKLKTRQTDGQIWSRLAVTRREGTKQQRVRRRWTMDDGRWTTNNQQPLNGHNEHHHC